MSLYTWTSLVDISADMTVEREAGGQLAALSDHSIFNLKLREIRP